MSRIIAFDIGIKNLAYCIFEDNVVIRMENCNILKPVEKNICSSAACKSEASYSSSNNELVCKRHIPKSMKVFEGAQTVAALRAAAKANNRSGKSKKELQDSLKDIYAFPVQKVKQPKAATQSLVELHDALRQFVTDKWESFKMCNIVLLENQPAFKNPHMKSVQVLLFATLREWFLREGVRPSMHLVHAKKKVQDAEKGDEGYAERKSKSEDRVRTLFEENRIRPLSIFEEWSRAKKKSDMADALCMCVDWTEYTACK